MSNPQNSGNTADRHYDVGIVGLWYGLNYGSILTYYALYDVIRTMGYSAVMINKPDAIWTPVYTDKNTIANKFIYKYCDNNVTKTYHSSGDFMELNKMCDSFVVGSDVVWNCKICGKANQFFFLDFVDDSKKKIAMASSFGGNYDGTEDVREWSERYLKKFDYIGVREREGVKIVEEVFHTHADQVMDPVFLADRKIYHDLAAKSTVENNEKYISSYILGPSARKREFLLKIIDITGYDYKCVPNPNTPDTYESKLGLKTVPLPTVEDWLKYFENTSCYIGDSFHGLCFSLIFGKPFMCVCRYTQTLPRFKTILATVGLEERLVIVDENNNFSHLGKEYKSADELEGVLRDILNKPIDYEKVWGILDENAKRSYEWLENALKSEKKNTAKAPLLRNPNMGDLHPLTVAGIPEDVCTGCAACMNSCPVDAITMQENGEGFMMPAVNTEKCIKCGKCSRICPAANTPLDNMLEPAVYAAAAVDRIKLDSTSGGMFAAAAEYVLENGGYVAGAIFDFDKFEVYHKVTNTADGLAQIKKSKYVQSNIGLVYRDVKALLDEGKTVLFSGTPCQVGGIKAYLGKKYDNLYTLDIFCHGTPPQKILKKYIEEITRRPEINLGEEPPKVTNILFRDKEHYGWRSSPYIRVEFDNGTVHIGDINELDAFQMIFKKKYAHRKSCGYCQFCAFPRPGDISIGDFWTINNVAPEMFDDKGISILFVNNCKGAELLEAITPKMDKIKKIKMRASDVKGNRIRALYPVSRFRDRFMSLIEHHSLANTVKMINDGRFEVGLVCNHYSGEFGGALTNFALYNSLEDLGYSTLMIERPKTCKNLTAVMDTAKAIHLAPLYPAYACALNYNSRSSMRTKLSELCDSFVVGSEKMFDYVPYMAFDKISSLSWVPDTKKKIAYSAAFAGYDSGEPKETHELGYFMKKFDYISARDENNAKICKELFGAEAGNTVLDPLFLCDMSHYQELISRSTRKLPEKYVSAYIMDPSKSKALMIAAIKDQLGADCDVFSEYRKPESYFAPLGDLYKGQVKTEERLQSIANCEFFVTDSYHGACLAIILRKPFVAVINKKRGADRFYALAKMFGLEDRFITDISQLSDDLINTPIDYDRVYEILDREKEKSINWLKDALGAPKAPVLSDYDVMYRLFEENQNSVLALKDLIIKMTDEMSGKLYTKSTIDDYLPALKNNKNGNIIVIAVKDTPGLALNKAIADSLMELGIETDLSGKHGHSYIAVFNDGKKVFEKLSKDEEPIIFNSVVDGHKLHLTSRVYENGNEAIIDINGKDYSVNGRGLNIVVFNKKTKKPVDSVCFDTHIRSFDCTR